MATLTSLLVLHIVSVGLNTTTYAHSAPYYHDCKIDTQIELGNIRQRLKRMSPACRSVDTATPWVLRECLFEENVDTSLSDHNLQDAWYSLTNYRLSEQTDSVSIGDCGTYYPIYLKEPLPMSLLDGGEVDVTVTVIGLDKYGDYDFTIKARHCHGTIQYLLPHPPVRNSAYCLEFGRQCTKVDDCGLQVHMYCADGFCMCAKGYDAVNNICTDLGLSCSQIGTCEAKNTECGADNTCNCLQGFVPIDGQCIYDATAPAPDRASVKANLNYYIDEVANMYKPYIEFICDVFMYVGNRPPIYSCLISWYADGTHLKTSDVLIGGREALTGLQLTEMELVEAGYKMGVKIKCGVQTANAELRLWRTEKLTDEITAGVEPMSPLFLRKGDNTTLFQPHSNVPFGCSSEIGATEASRCELNVLVADNIAGAVCSAQGPTGDRSAHCGMRLPGVTKDEWDANGGEWQGWNYFHDYEYDSDTKLYTDFESGLFVRTDSDDDYNEKQVVLRSMTEKTNQHNFWNDYMFPDVKVYVDDTSSGHTITMSIKWYGDYSAIRISNRDRVYEQVWLVEEGEYIFVRSSDLPYQVHVTLDRSLSVCGITCRIRNSIYALGYTCDGALLSGVIHGPAEYDEFRRIQSRYSSMKIDKGSYSFWHQTNYTRVFMRIPATLGNIEGIASISNKASNGTYQHRNGVRSDDVAEFLRSWKARSDDSLMDPQNHFDVSLSETKWTCGCPRQSVFTTNQSWSYEVNLSDTYLRIYSYFGEVMCSLHDGHRCTETTQGRTDCNRRTAPNHGNVSTPNGTSYGQRAKYTCHQGYDMIGENTSSCLENGTWSNGVPHCVIVDCNRRTAPNHGTVSTPNGTTYGQRAEYTCGQGYDMIGEPISSCLETGIWSNGVPHCVIADCNRRTAPNHGTVSTPNGTTYGQRAEYTCGQGYDMIGENTSSCLETGIWSNGVPNCVIAEADIGPVVGASVGALVLIAVITCVVVLYKKGYRIMRPEDPQAGAESQDKSPAGKTYAETGPCPIYEDVVEDPQAGAEAQDKRITAAYELLGRSQSMDRTYDELRLADPPDYENTIR